MLKKSPLVLVSVCLLGLAGLIASGSSPAQADSGVSIGPPDKGKHMWCLAVTNNSTLTSTASVAISNLAKQTDVNTVYYQPCQYNTDVNIGFSNLSAYGAYGIASCSYRWPNGDCNRFRVRVDLAATNGSGYGYGQRTKTMCHEIGHSVGVDHYTAPNRPGGDKYDSCLRSGTVWSNSSSWHTRYGPHHIYSHINPWF